MYTYMFKNCLRRAISKSYAKTQTIFKFQIVPNNYNKCLEKMDIDPGATPEATPGTPGQVQEINSSIEEIFLFTLNKYSVIGGPFSQLVFLSGLADVVGHIYFLPDLRYLKFKNSKKKKKRDFGSEWVRGG